MNDDEDIQSDIEDLIEQQSNIRQSAVDFQ